MAAAARRSASASTPVPLRQMPPPPRRSCSPQPARRQPSPSPAGRPPAPARRRTSSPAPGGAALWRTSSAGGVSAPATQRSSRPPGPPPPHPHHNGGGAQRPPPRPSPAQPARGTRNTSISPARPPQRVAPGRPRSASPFAPARLRVVSASAPNPQRARPPPVPAARAHPPPRRVASRSPQGRGAPVRAPDRCRSTECTARGRVTPVRQSDTPQRFHHLDTTPHGPRSTPVRLSETSQAPAPRRREASASPGSRRGLAVNSSGRLSDVSSTAAHRRSSSVSPLRHSVVSLNKEGICSFRHVAEGIPNCEFLYLRENRLHELDHYMPLGAVKVLDLSLNQLETAAFLWDLRRDPADLPYGVTRKPQFPHLRHLYLTGNLISSLNWFQFLGIETLALSRNRISSFEGLGALTALRVLFLQDNDISSWKYFPCLPKLQQLSLEGNPIAQHEAYRVMAFAVAAGGSGGKAELAKIDGAPVTAPERSWGRALQCAAAPWLLEGCVISDGALPLGAQEGGGDPWGEAGRAAVAACGAAARREALQLQRSSAAGAPLVPLALAVEPAQSEAPPFLAEAIHGPRSPAEGEPLRFCVALQDARTEDTPRFQSGELQPIAFSIINTSDQEVSLEGSIVGGWKGKGVPMDAAPSEDGRNLCRLVAYLPQGRHEYRFRVGREVLLDNPRGVSAVPSVGQCSFLDVPQVAAAGGEGDTLIHLRWLRGDDCGGFEDIPGANGLQYTPGAEDVGRCLRAEALCYVSGVFRSVVWTITEPVAPAPPRVAALELAGGAREGSLLAVDVRYCGGVEGQSEVTWAREHPGGGTAHHLPGAEGFSYRLTAEDVGCVIVAQYTPVRADGTRGPPATARSAPVAPLPPSVVGAQLVFGPSGGPIEGEPVEVRHGLQGGGGGVAARYEWRHDGPGGSAVPWLPDRPVCTPTAADVGRVLAVTITPWDREAAAPVGDPVTLVAGEVRDAPPTITKLSIVGDPVAGGTLAVDVGYSGGLAGEHSVQWSRARPGQPAGPAQHAGAEYCLADFDVGYCLEVEVWPVRQDGVTGESKRARSAVIRPYPTQIGLTGDAQEGSALHARVHPPGHARLLQWYRQRGGAREHLAHSDGSSSLRLGPSDIGSRIIAAAAPPGADPVECASAAVRPGPPLAYKVAVTGGAPVVGRQLTGSFSYSGGRQGEHSYRWQRLRSGEDRAQICGDALRYTPSARDSEASLLFGVLARRDDGQEAAGWADSDPTGPVTLPRECPTVALAPDTVVEGRAVEADVRGADPAAEGTCLWSCDLTGTLGSGISCTPTPDEAGGVLSFSYTLPPFPTITASARVRRRLRRAGVERDGAVSWAEWSTPGGSPSPAPVAAAAGAVLRARWEWADPGDEGCAVGCRWERSEQAGGKRTGDWEALCSAEEYTVTESDCGRQLRVRLRPAPAGGPCSEWVFLAARVAAAEPPAAQAREEPPPAAQPAAAAPPAAAPAPAAAADSAPLLRRVATPPDGPRGVTPVVSPPSARRGAPGGVTSPGSGGAAAGRGSAPRRDGSAGSAGVGPRRDSGSRGVGPRRDSGSRGLPATPTRGVTTPTSAPRGLTTPPSGPAGSPERDGSVGSAGRRGRGRGRLSHQTSPPARPQVPPAEPSPPRPAEPPAAEAEAPPAPAPPPPPPPQLPPPARWLRWPSGHAACVMKPARVVASASDDAAALVWQMRWGGSEPWREVQANCPLQGPSRRGDLLYCPVDWAGAQVRCAVSDGGPEAQGVRLQLPANVAAMCLRLLSRGEAAFSVAFNWQGAEVDGVLHLSERKLKLKLVDGEPLMEAMMGSAHEVRISPVSDDTSGTGAVITGLHRIGFSGPHHDKSLGVRSNSEAYRFRTLAEAKESAAKVPACGGLTLGGGFYCLRGHTKLRSTAGETSWVLVQPTTPDGAPLFQQRKEEDSDKPWTCAHCKQTYRRPHFEDDDYATYAHWSDHGRTLSLCRHCFEAIPPQHRAGSEPVPPFRISASPGFRAPEGGERDGRCRRDTIILLVRVWAALSDPDLCLRFCGEDVHRHWANSIRRLRGVGGASSCSVGADGLYSYGRVTDDPTPREDLLHRAFESPYEPAKHGMPQHQPESARDEDLRALTALREAAAALASESASYRHSLWGEVRENLPEPGLRALRIGSSGSVPGSPVPTSPTSM